jgi:hypothetical protein
MYLCISAPQNMYNYCDEAILPVATVPLWTLGDEVGGLPCAWGK